MYLSSGFILSGYWRAKEEEEKEEAKKEDKSGRD
jgi:hypothetical protein